MPRAATPRRPGALVIPSELERWTDEELIRAAQAGGEGAPGLLDVLFRRHQPRVAAWSLRWCGGRAEDAADLAQEVFLRAQEKLAGFRFQSAFSTWLYLVTRSVALNRADAARRRPSESLEAHAIDPQDPAPGADQLAEREQLAERLRTAIAVALEPLEGRVLHLHYHEGLTLPAIDHLLGLTNRSGAKAYLVAAKRKLRRHFEAVAAATDAAVEEEA